MQEQAVYWNIKVSKETDSSARTLLGAQGRKKGDFSKFVEDAVRWRVFHCTVQNIKDRNVDKNSEQLQRIINQAVHEVRTQRRVKKKS